jgi:hypothetical protein
MIVYKTERVFVLYIIYFLRDDIQYWLMKVEWWVHWVNWGREVTE